jgi:4-aminobutyrate aminotransferase-like enzyme
MSSETLFERRERLLGAGAPLFYREPVHIVRGEGAWLYDASGRRYLDMYNNVPCVGHAHPHVVEAMNHQAATLNVHSRYLHEGILDYAERLMGLHAEPLSSVVFTCTGTEASEVAMLMARAATGGRGIISTDACYHGNSAEVRKLSASRWPAEDPAFRAIPFPQEYRPLQEGVHGAALTDLYLAEVQAAIDGFERDNVPFAGMFVCSILANEGLPDIPPGFMPRAAELVRRAGGLFIADEVQAGFCRTGHWWGYEVMDFVPDIVTMGKPMGSGLPLAAVAANSELVDSFRREARYFNTFASSPLQAAVGMAVLDVIENEHLRSSVAEVGAYLQRALKELEPNWEPIGDVRGHGLFIGLEWVSDRAAKTPDRKGAIDVVNRLKDKGFLISNAGALGNVLKIRPPLVFNKEHADLFLTAFEETLHERYGQT